jgi:hypothetical protein
MNGDTTLTNLYTFASLAAQTSLTTYTYGIPFGGTTSWLIVVIMANDSGTHPYAPFQAAIIGYPITIVCDILLLIPLLLCWITNSIVSPTQTE